MRISLKNWEKARKLLGKGQTADLHLDLPGELLLRHRSGERDVIRRRYLPTWKSAGICLVGAAIYLEDDYLPESGLREALLQIEALREELALLDGEAHLVRTREELEMAYHTASVGILLYLEGLDFIGTDACLLELLCELGVSGAALTWSRRNVLACGCCRASENREICGGITETGRDVLCTMQKLHMFLDISHLNDEGTAQALAWENAGLPILATHSDAREIFPHYRNLTDGQLRLLARRGGVAGLNACSLLTGSAGSGRHLDQLCRHGLHMMEIAGEDHICLGLDLCHNYELARRELKTDGGQGNDCLADHGELTLFVAAILESGMSERQAEKLLGQNAFVFLEKSLPEKCFT